MRVLHQILCGTTVCLYLFAIPLSAADYYKLNNVKRLDQNLYKADGGIIIETQFCMHLTLGEDAILKWDGIYSPDNKIVWDDDSSCDVKKLLR